MIKYLPFLLLAGCVTYQGHTIPDCDTSGLTPSIVMVDRVPSVPGMADPYALWTPHGIYIERTAPEWVVEHELKHQCMYELTGSPAWHG